LVLGSQFLVLGSWFLVLGSQFSVLGSWFLVPGSWFLVLGSWFLNTMRLSRSGFILIAVSSVTCVFAAALLFALRPRPITSHADAIATILDRRSIVYERVTTDQVWPAAVNYYAYGPSVYPYSATVSVRLPDDTIVPGSLECADDRRRCRVTIVRFAIDNEPIPDISSVQPLPWMEWLRQVIRMVRSFGYVTFVSNVPEKYSTGCFISG